MRLTATALALTLFTVPALAKSKPLVVDLKTMRVVGHVAVGEDPDVLAFDPLWRRLYVAAESGEVTVFTASDGHLARDGRITMPDAQTVSVDPRTHLVYFPLKDVDGHPLLRIMSARHL